jgi:hypothetical protein
MAPKDSKMLKDTKKNMTIAELNNKIKLNPIHWII